ncbi:MAG: trehalose-6-phosphate synthase [Thermodesulfobacteriota bacterium]|nr:trehalose-6-phosphate synthase [Thermodesulfobacteriota bacterium]
MPIGESVRITFRIIFSILIVISLLVLLFTLVQVRQEKERLNIDLERRASLLGESLKESIEPLIERGRPERLQKIVEKFGNRERLAGVAVYDVKDKLIAATPPLSRNLSTPPTFVTNAMNSDQEEGRFFHLGGKEMYLYALPLHREENVAGALLIIYDTSYIQDRLSLVWKNNFIRFLVNALVISLTTLLLIRWSMTGPIAKMAEWMKSLRTEKNIAPLSLPPGGLFEPLTREVAHMARSISVARLAAEEEARLRHAAESIWTPGRLREQVRSLLQEKPLFVISNREPYMHEKRGKKIECLVPASGLVTALEPVLMACGGMWIAHGSGDADREMVDSHDVIRVPPENPEYLLKRVWLTKEEERGYYYGFSNEGLWPLCHIAHTRPSFRTEDWEYYQIVNRKFAQKILEELEGIEEPLVLIQDYHFALLPRLIKDERPDARVAIFWHIPWPNPESFGICPWQRELLHGMLGADLIGFHIQYHCNNFLDTVDRALESRIDWEHFTVKRGDQTTLVKPFPISISFPPPCQDLAIQGTKPNPENLLKELGVKGKYLGVGVDRIDYTKGILERFKAIERFLEKYPAYQGGFTYVELGAPSRTHIKEYHDLIAEVEAETDRINWRFQTKAWKPIVFLKKHHSHEEIKPFYETADLCLVTSLHDGMNLVAKEFVGSREDEGGVLVLSQFTGASRELRDALVVNPYDIEQMAEAIRTALEMDPAEKKIRMQRMRETIKDRNIYHWAAELIAALAQVRLEKQL